MAGAGSGGSIYSNGYRSNRLTCMPALAVQSTRPKCAQQVGMQADCGQGLLIL